MDLKTLKQTAVNAIYASTNAEALEEVRVKYLGRKGELTELLRTLKELPVEERKKVGPQLNALREELSAACDVQAKKLVPAAKKNRLDVTKPGTRMAHGHFHPLTLVDREVRSIFTSMHFDVVEGPEIESEFYNFDALNIPKNHPARDMWDTFWIKEGAAKKTDGRLLLRTHTSPMQVRYMEKHTPPFQIIVPGRVFRYEATDASHEINFYQVEGLMVGPDVTLANFKFIVEEFFRKFFGPTSGGKLEFRFRPSYFPFVEPGLEVDIRMKGGKWLEVMGAGMVHRNVLDAVRYNPDTVQGFAFGMGLDRLAMIKYKVPDIRLFYGGDVRFVQQFKA